MVSNEGVMKTVSSGMTDVGRARHHNEDSFLINDGLGLFVVADGMGGHAGGEVASRISVRVVERELLLAREREPDLFEREENGAVSQVLEQAVQTASSEVFRHSMSNPLLFGMGTTLTGLLLQGGQAWVAHVGDSRIYLVRSGRIRQLSEDHSLVQEQIRAGILTPEEARHSHLRNIITRSVGFESSVPVDILREEVMEGDVFLLCSDGLSNLVDEEEIAALVESSAGTEEIPPALIDLANDRGGDDNITAIVVRVEG